MDKNIKSGEKLYIFELMTSGRITMHGNDFNNACTNLSNYLDQKKRKKFDKDYVPKSPYFSHLLQE